MHSKIFYDECVWNAEKLALWSLDHFGDIDILYDEGGIIRSICAKNNATLLKAALDYFENKQFPDKGDQYQIAHGKLREILEEVSDWTDSSSTVHSLISEYIGSDIARLSDVCDAEDLVPSRQPSSENGSTLLTASMLNVHDKSCGAVVKEAGAESYASGEGLDPEDVVAAGVNSSMHVQDVE